MEEAGSSDVDMVMLLDLRIVDKMTSFTDVIVEINGMFFAPGGEGLARIGGKGVTMVPNPASSKIPDSTNKALAQFQQALNVSAELVEFSRRVAGRKPETETVCRCC